MKKGAHNFNIWPPIQFFVLYSKSNLERYIFYCRNGFGTPKYIKYDYKMKILWMGLEILEISLYLACNFDQIFMFRQKNIKIAQNWGRKHYLFIAEMDSAQKIHKYWVNGENLVDICVGLRYFGWKWTNIQSY